MTSGCSNAKKTIEEMFHKAKDIIANECKINKTEDLLRQFEIVRTGKFQRITDEPDILNNLIVQASSYSVLRKYFGVLYPEDIHKLDSFYSTTFFKNSPPTYRYGDWVNIVLNWGTNLLNKEGLPEQRTLDDLVTKLKLAKNNTWRSYTKQPKSRMVLSLATALPKVKREILNDPVSFISRLDDISTQHPGKAFDSATNFAKGIIEMGNPLVCNFFKELGLLYYVKIDIHVSNFLNNIAFSKQLNPKEKFILSWLLAKEARIEPFILDKILYIGGKYAKQKMVGLFDEYRSRYVQTINRMISELPRYM